MENIIPTSQPQKRVILPWVLGTLLIVSTVIIILFATQVIGKTSIEPPNVKLFVDRKTMIDLKEIFTFVVQVKHVSEILADQDISCYFFNHNTTSPNAYEIHSFEGKLSNFTYSMSMGTDHEPFLIKLTYDPNSNEFDISMTQTGTEYMSFLCTQQDSLEFLIASPLR